MIFFRYKECYFQQLKSYKKSPKFLKCHLRMQFLIPFKFPKLEKSFSNMKQKDILDNTKK
jgi:hypothetical protein